MPSIGSGCQRIGILLTDQVPQHFVVDQNKTYDITGNKQAWVS